MADGNGSSDVFGDSMNRKEFAEKRRETAQKTIPELIELLESENLQTRFFAEMCLRDATGT